MSYYVYCQHIDSGRVDYVNSYETMKEAVERIRINLNIDAQSCSKNEYYYFIKQRG